MQNTAKTIVQRLQKNGYQAYWAGGCVRDLILKKEPEDIDIATSAKPEEIEKLFKKTYAIGKHFGVILIEENGHHFEIATFRSDSGYSDGRRPDYVTFSRAEEDALRRDFTINGIFYDPVTAKFHDFVDGQSDLKRGLLRFIGDPSTRIQEDHLRILRAVRFRNRFDLAYHIDTRKALKRHCSLILGVAAERVLDELNKIIVHHDRKKAFEDLDRFGILEEIIPEVSALKKIHQDKTMHSEGNAFVHTLLVLHHIPLGSNPEIAWAALLHDIGKAKTMKYEGDRIRFYGHQEVVIDMATKILVRLKFSRAARDRILWLIHHHHLFDTFHDMAESRKLHYFDHPYFADLLTLYHADLLGCVPQDRTKWKQAEEYYYQIRAEYELAHREKKLPSHHAELLTGAEIMELLNLPAGPEVGKIKEKIREMQLEKKITTKEEARGFLKSLKPPKTNEIF